MSIPDQATQRCLLSLPGQYSKRTRAAIEKGVQRANFLPVSVSIFNRSSEASDFAILGELARADCILADLSGNDPQVFFELGAARAMEKGVVIVSAVESDRNPTVFLDYPVIRYTSASMVNLTRLTREVQRALLAYRASPPRKSFLPAARSATPFFIDWDRLERPEVDNLIRELLAQLGYQRVDWETRIREIDLVAELPKKDPDGFEYRELWLIVSGRGAPPEFLFDMLHDMDYFRERLFDLERRSNRFLNMSEPITILFILTGREHDQLQFRKMQELLARRSSKREAQIRVRIWDRAHLTSLVQQFPQIGYKYFSDEARSQSKYRKTPEELNQENVDLVARQAQLINDLEEEKGKRVRAERDAVWKDISFTTAHKIGNPIFAIETNLDPLERRVKDGRNDEAMQIIGSIRSSVEKAKTIVDQFKSLSRAQEIHRISTPLAPLLSEACQIARSNGVECDISCPPDLVCFVDADRFSECLDELVSNSLHWMEQPPKRIQMSVDPPPVSPLPESLDTGEIYLKIEIKDNGPGVELENKARIFDAFFTTREHGTGLGLAVVRRIIEGHRGLILESGIPGCGADFAIYLATQQEHRLAAGGTKRRELRSGKE